MSWVGRVAEPPELHYVRTLASPDRFELIHELQHVSDCSTRLGT